MGTAIKIFRSVEDLSQFFSQYLVKGIDECHKGRSFSIALSGGSTPRSIFKYMAANLCDKIEWKRVLVFWSDERCVAPDDQESNFRMAKENLLDYVPIPESNINRIIGEADPFNEAQRYAETVRRLVPSCKDIPRFDLMMLGLGEDGHTASIFPGNLDLFNSKKLFDVVEHPKTGQQRITASGRLINNSGSVVFLVTGEAKSEIASMVIERKAESYNLPASHVNPVNGELLWLLDDKAARIINN